MWKKLASKEEDKKVSEDDTARRKKDVQTYETILVRVFHLIGDSLDKATESENASLDALIQSEQSVLRCCQLMCLQIGNKNAFESELDRVAVILKKCANALDYIETKLDNNQKLAHFQDQVLYTLGVVAYRLIKVSLKEEAERASETIWNCNEAEQRTRQLLDNCLGLFGVSELPVFLQRIQGCMSSSESTSPEDDAAIKSIVDPQQN